MNYRGFTLYADGFLRMLPYSVHGSVAHTPLTHLEQTTLYIIARRTEERQRMYY